MPRRVQHDRDSSDDEERAAGVVAASAGNHGQAVAWAAREAGVRARIYVPARRADGEGRGARRTTAARARARGRDASRTRSRGAARTPSETGATFVHRVRGPGRHRRPGHDRARARGAAAAGVDTCSIPVGGGGLAAGIAHGAAGRRSRTCGSSACSAGKSGYHDRGRDRRQAPGRADDERCSTRCSTTWFDVADEEITEAIVPAARAVEARRRGRAAPSASRRCLRRQGRRRRARPSPSSRAATSTRRCSSPSCATALTVAGRYLVVRTRSPTGRAS